MYQWRERKERREETSVGGSKTTRTIYHYERDWDDDLIDSADFAEPEGHRNPTSMPFPSREWRAESVSLGAVPLTPEVVAEVDGWRPMAVQPERLPANLAATFGVDDGALSTVQGAPEVGDVRIRFFRLPEGPLSVVARAGSGGLEGDPREQGTLLLVERGTHSADALFDMAESRNAGIGWLIRMAGFVLMWVGFTLVLAPLAVFADIIPAFGQITRWISALIGGVLAALISFVAIASGWLYHRPWLLGLMLIAIAAGLGWLLMRGRKAQPAAPRSVPPPPPPPPPA
nr:TMEM43 family protein [Lysobacter sp. CAU 1642]